MSKSVLFPDQIASNSCALTDLFAESYGEGFVGAERFRAGYLDPADRAFCIGALPDLGAVALLRNTRITASATSPDRERFGSRFDLLVSLMGDVRKEEPSAWASVGTSAREVIRAATIAAGMKRSDDEDLLNQRLSKFGDVSRYQVERTSEGLLIALRSSQKGPDYWQEVWDWPA